MELPELYCEGVPIGKITGTITFETKNDLRDYFSSDEGVQEKIWMGRTVSLTASTLVSDVDLKNVKSLCVHIPAGHLSMHSMIYAHMFISSFTLVCQKKGKFVYKNLICDADRRML